ncbi:PIG-L deacetylase family protein [Pseudooceanicola sp. HF7]|uniref:PIG-L deacetylase family protein n=1 Tax=Pseudooceanicola sp. HF7 TaxID=2721560 RepID=UPI0014319069|nr:PIG-L family deacetylase [Pseudooceanicola sp. HF7]NIZ11265.1 PIG-L family deacetylase [Pseudooceanicola sp. HF7]
MMTFTGIVTQAQSAPLAQLAELTGPGAVLVLAPHPDDESLAMGGAIAAASAAGHRVHVAVVTDGALSHPGSRAYPAAALSALRKAEVELAIDILTQGRETPIWLGYPDQGAPDDPGAFSDVETRLRCHLGGVTAIWTTWNGDPHSDHQKVWRLARWMAEPLDCGMFACPVWGRVQSPVAGASSAGLRRFQTTAYREVKARAVAAHASQMTGLITDDPEGFRMPQDLAAHFVAADEIFIPS